MKNLILILLSIFVGPQFAEGQSFSTLTYSGEGSGLCIYTDVEKSSVKEFEVIDQLIENGPSYVQNNLVKSEITYDAYHKCGTIRVWDSLIDSLGGEICKFDVIYSFDLDSMTIVVGFEATFYRDISYSDKALYNYNGGVYWSEGSTYDPNKFDSNGEVECERSIKSPYWSKSEFDELLATKVNEFADKKLFFQYIE